MCLALLYCFVTASTGVGRDLRAAPQGDACGQDPDGSSRRGAVEGEQRDGVDRRAGARDRAILRRSGQPCQPGRVSPHRVGNSKGPGDHFRAQYFGPMIMRKRPVTVVFALL